MNERQRVESASAKVVADTVRTHILIDESTAILTWERRWLEVHAVFAEICLVHSQPTVAHAGYMYPGRTAP